MQTAAKQVRENEMAHGEAIGQTNGGLEHIASEDKRSLMAKANEKSAEKFEITKGNFLLFGVGCSLLTLVFSYGGSALSWARNDQSKEENIKQVQTDLKEFQEEMKEDLKDIKESAKDQNAKWEKMSDRLSEQEKRYERIDGFKAGVAESQSDRK